MMDNHLPLLEKESGGGRMGSVKYTLEIILLATNYEQGKSSFHQPFQLTGKRLQSAE